MTPARRITQDRDTDGDNDDDSSTQPGLLSLSASSCSESSDCGRQKAPTSAATLFSNWDGNGSTAFWSTYLKGVHQASVAQGAFAEAMAADPRKFAKLLTATDSPYRFDEGTMSDDECKHRSVVAYSLAMFSVQEVGIRKLLTVVGISKHLTVETKLKAEKGGPKLRVAYQKNLCRIFWVLHNLIKMAPDLYPTLRHCMSQHNREGKEGEELDAVCKRGHILDLTATSPGLIEEIHRAGFKLPFSSRPVLMRCFGGRSQTGKFVRLNNTTGSIEDCGPPNVDAMFSSIALVEATLHKQLYANGSGGMISATIKEEDAASIALAVSGIPLYYWEVERRMKLTTINENKTLLTTEWAGAQDRKKKSCIREVAMKLADIAAQEELFQPADDESCNDESDDEAECLGDCQGDMGAKEMRACFTKHKVPLLGTGARRARKKGKVQGLHSAACSGTSRRGGQEET